MLQFEFEFEFFNSFQTTSDLAVEKQQIHARFHKKIDRLQGRHKSYVYICVYFHYFVEGAWVLAFQFQFNSITKQHSISIKLGSATKLLLILTVIEIWSVMKRTMSVQIFANGFELFLCNTLLQKCMHNLIIPVICSICISNINHLCYTIDPTDICILIRFFSRLIFNVTFILLTCFNLKNRLRHTKYINRMSYSFQVFVFKLAFFDLFYSDGFIDVWLMLYSLA